MKSKNQFIDFHVEYIRNEIEIRIESIKIELDKLYTNISQNLDSIKLELLEYVNLFINTNNGSL